MKINFNNYHLATTGEFTKFTELHSINIYKKRSAVLNIKWIQLLLETKYGRKLTLNYISTKSIYFTNKSKTKLFRVSQHWSNECGMIRSCMWKIKRDNKRKYKWEVGVIKFSDLKAKVNNNDNKRM